MPNVPNTPMLTTKGELAAGGHVSLKGNLNFNTAYAVTNNFAVMFNGGTMNNESRKRDTENNTIEVGGGYFNTFGPDHKRIIEIVKYFDNPFYISKEQVYLNNKNN